MPFNPARALELLRLGTQSPTAAFRDGQDDAIRHVVEGRGRLLQRIFDTSPLPAPQPSRQAGGPLPALPRHLIRPAATFSPSDAEKGNRRGEGEIFAAFAAD